MFKKAERKLAKLRLGICGASGSGKTWSALTIATGMGGKIAILDTERRAHLYAADFDYDIAEIDAPYSPDKYISAIKMAEKAGYDILIIDSLSHAWVGDGGILSIVDRAGGSTFQNGWRVATPQHNALIDAIITSKLHVIVTMRSKTEYVMEQNEKGRIAPKKIGLAPVQRDGLEYEFTLFMDMSQDHVAHVTKDNTRMYDQQYIKPTTEMGEKIRDWLMNGKTQEEIEKECMDDIDRQLANAKDIESLKAVYQDTVNQYPKYKDVIINLAQSKKAELQQGVH